MKTFILASVIAALLVIIISKIFAPEIDGFTERVRNAKPQKIGVNPKLGN